MTAPVQMEYHSDEQGKPKQATMAFFYGDPKAGTTGPDGSVEVIDVPATKVVSIGMRVPTRGSGSKRPASKSRIGLRPIRSTRSPATCG